jgi:sugar lactone lactonase YvrE
MRKLFVGAVLCACFITPARPLRADSYYQLKPDDPRAVYVTKEQFNVQGDGIADDANGIQQAIDSSRRGIVFIPEGRYRLGKTIYVWSGTRVIGYGQKRPVFVLGKNTPGFQDISNKYEYEGTGKYMVHFANGRSGMGGSGTVNDASEVTFYSSMANIDFEMQDGNPAAIAIRFHIAQHCSLQHMDFHVGTCRAALEDIGNQASDIHVYGGKYGIITKRTSPVWQFLLTDSSFEGQTDSGIHTMEVGFTLMRVRFSHMPIAIQIAPGEVEQLYGRDLQMEDIRTAALKGGNTKNTHSEITLTNIACSNVPTFYQGDENVAAPSQHYMMDRFTLGLMIADDGREAGIAMQHKEHSLQQPAPAVACDIPALPPMSEWVNVHTLDVKGDGRTDDTAALKAAIEKHKVLYLPSGSYLVSTSIELKPDTVLIGLHPSNTSINLANGAAGFDGEGDPVGVLVAPKGGKNIVVSISVGPGSNSRAAGVVWMAGPNSLLDDMSFSGGGGGGGFGGFGGGARGAGPGRGDANNVGRGGPGGMGRGDAGGFARGGMGRGDANGVGRGDMGVFARGAGMGRGDANGVGRGGPGGMGRGDAGGFARGGRGGPMGPDLLIKDGGGGIFRGNWPHSTSSRIGGLRIENTSTVGKIYQISVEHHNRVETMLHNVQNWEIYALQTEEENPAGHEAFSTEIQDCKNILIANLYMYRVSRTTLPKTYAVMVKNSDDIRFENAKVFSQTRLAFDNAVLDEDSGVAVRSQFFTNFVIKKGSMKPPAPAAQLPVVFEKGAKIEKLAGDFSNASGLTVDDAGHLFFTDAGVRKIYRWNDTDKKAQLIATTQGQPMVLGFVKPSTLLIVAYERAVYSLNIAESNSTPQMVTGVAEKQPDTQYLLPVGLHNMFSILNDLMIRRDYIYQGGSNTAVSRVNENAPRSYFYAPGTKTAIFAGGTWRPILQSSNMIVFSPGDEHYIVSEDDGKTYRVKLGADEKLTSSVFVNRGGTSVINDAAGNVYVASDQVYIYDREGKQIGVLATPERPGSLAFGGADGRTLFIGARSSLYSVRMAGPGR